MKIVGVVRMIERSAQQLSDHLKLALQDEITASQLAPMLRFAVLMIFQNYIHREESSH